MVKEINRLRGGIRWYAAIVQVRSENIISPGAMGKKNIFNGLK